MKLTCENLRTALATHCYQASNDQVAVCTPHNSFKDTPIYAYFTQHGSEVVISDNGNTLFEAFSVCSQNKTLKAASRRVIEVGAACSDGVISVTTDPKLLTTGYALFEKACIEVVSYVNGAVTTDEEAWSIIEDVERHILRRNSINVKIKKNVQITGINKTVVQFPLQADERLIDAIRPHSASTGSVLRRSAAVEAVGYPSPLIIVDDTDHPNAARAEASMINSLCRTMLFSELKFNDGVINLAA